MIYFNKPNIYKREFKYIKRAYKECKISGDGVYTNLCSKFIEENLEVKKCLLTTSCTHALEMAALLIDLKPNDEFILPSYTFVSTVNAFMLRGANPVFCDIDPVTLNIETNKIEKLITPKTRAIIIVHYAGFSCNMEKMRDIAQKHKLYLIEDAAQAIFSKYKNKYLGSIGDLGCLSFHETKNFIMGEGGALLINNSKFIEKAEIIREKGTNRSKFFRGEIDKYTWTDIGSSYLPSDINAAVLWSQFKIYQKIQRKREYIYNYYYSKLKDLENNGSLRLPEIPEYNRPNHHMFYLLLNTGEVRDKLIAYLKQHGIIAVFHYVPLHSTEFYKNRYKSINLPVTEEISERLLRLPLYYKLKTKQLKYIVKCIDNFFKKT